MALYRALLSESPADFPVQASHAFFAAPGGRTAMVFSAGVRPGDLAPKKGKKPELEATVLVRVRNVVLESMACGTPPVTRRLRGLDGYFLFHEENALVFDEREEIRPSVERLATDAELRRALRENGLRLVREQLSFDAVAEKLFHAFAPSPN